MTIRRPLFTTGGTLFAALLVFASPSMAPASTFFTLHSFQGRADGRFPLAGVAIGADGVLYGTTSGGTIQPGSVVSVTPPASPGGGWTTTVLHRFGGAGDGANPFAGVTIGAGGVLYGTTAFGGALGTGTVYSLTPPASPGGTWTEAVLYSFAGGPNDGATPYAGVTIGPGGVLYGTTTNGGNHQMTDLGTVFSLTPPASPGGAWTEAVLYKFTGVSGDGNTPIGNITIGSGGLIYGTTYFGGDSSCNYGLYVGCGTVFSLTPPASVGGAWTETLLHDFAGAPADGANPYPAVTIGTGGILYGTTYNDGSGTCSAGCGTVFQLSPPQSPAGAWTEAVIHNFAGGTKHGSNPDGGVIIAPGGVLYGTTFYGGTSHRGTVFSLKPPSAPGGSWTETLLHSFDLTNGAEPQGGVTMGRHGALYGAASSGGSGPCAFGNGCGTVFELKP